MSATSDASFQSFPSGPIGFDSHKDSFSKISVNALGTWDATTGLMEAARRTVTGLLDAGVTVALDYVETGAPKDLSRISERLARSEHGRPYEIDLCFLNINEIQHLPESYLRTQQRSNYVIGSWYWELPTLPRSMVEQARRVDEIWVATEFVADAFARFVDVPIIVMPPVVDPSPEPGVGRERFGLSQSECVFLYNFDANSTFARKNPWGVLDAYRRAFDRQERGNGVRLIIKTLNLSRCREGASRLRYELGQLDGVLIEDDLTAGAMAALIKSCDIYVSMHRAEGFGLGMAEAMYFGKPVISTNYSGNRDFTTSANSFPISYSIREIEIGELRYNPGVEGTYVPGLPWAEPSVSEAAHWMRYLYENPSVRIASGLRAQATIRESYNSIVAGVKMKTRLAEISTKLSTAG